MQSARLNWTNARAQQAVSMFTSAGHGFYCNQAIAFAISAMTGNKMSLPALLYLFDWIVTVERSVYNKSMALNGLVNFCIANGDGVTAQHQLLNRVLGILMEKYY